MILANVLVLGLVGGFYYQLYSSLKKEHTELQIEISGLENKYAELNSTYKTLKEDYEDLRDRLCSFGDEGFSNYIKRGKLMDTDDFNDSRIIIWEDPNVFKALNGKYYMVFSGDTDDSFQRLWLWETSGLSAEEFQNGTLIGPILDNPSGTYENHRIRARNCLYDYENDRYVLAYDGNGNESNGACLLFSDRDDFPNGPWTEAFNNPIHLFEDPGCSWLIWTNLGRFYGIAGAWGETYLVTAEELDSPWCSYEIPKNQICGSVPAPIRGIAKIGSNLLIAGECWPEKQFRLFYAVWDGTFLCSYGVTEDKDEAWVIPTLDEEGTQVANNALYYDPESKTIKMFYQGKVEDGWKNLLLIDIPLEPYY